MVVTTTCDLNVKCVRQAGTAVAVLLLSYIVHQRLSPFVRVDSTEQQAAIGRVGPGSGLHDFIARKVQVARDESSASDRGRSGGDYDLDEISQKRRPLLVSAGTSTGLKGKLRRQSFAAVSSVTASTWQAIGCVSKAMFTTSIDYNVMESAFLVTSVSLPIGLSFVCGVGLGRTYPR